MSLESATPIPLSWATGLTSAKNGSQEALDHGPLPGADAPFLVDYELDRQKGPGLSSELSNRPWSMWRYRELLPIREFSERIDLGEGGTPMIRVPALAEGESEVWIKQESGNPTGSFKDRGLSMAVNRARELGAPGVQLPSAGNAAMAASAYSAAAELRCRVAMPVETPGRIVDRCRAYGAEVILEGQNLRESASRLSGHTDGFWDLSTFKEAYRVEGKKTMAFEMLERFGWSAPDWCVYPTGGGTGVVAMYKAFTELDKLGLLRGSFPRIVAVQMKGCAPIVDAFHGGAERAGSWEKPTTSVWGLRVPATVADFLILRAIRSTGGTAIAVAEERIAPLQASLAERTGLLFGPEGAAAIAGLEDLYRSRLIAPGDRIVVYQTGHPANYM